MTRGTMSSRACNRGVSLNDFDDMFDSMPSMPGFGGMPDPGAVPGLASSDSHDAVSTPVQTMHKTGLRDLVSKLLAANNASPAGHPKVTIIHLKHGTPVTHPSQVSTGNGVHIIRLGQPTQTIVVPHPKPPFFASGIFRSIPTGVASATRPSRSSAADYLALAHNKSTLEPGNCSLIVVSLDGVLGCELPKHLADTWNGPADNNKVQRAWTRYLTRPYAHTFIDYILHPKRPFCVAFWTSSMNRSQAMRFLHDLALPMGSVERDERDGFVGLWTSEDCQPGKDGKPVKNLETIWKDLNGEQNLRWDATNTVVITHKPEEMSAQPFNCIVVPRMTYIGPPSTIDQALHCVLGLLETMTSQSNFANYLMSVGYCTAGWIGERTAVTTKQLATAFAALRACAALRMPIVAWGSNAHVQ